MGTMKTPGVYVVEENDFGNSNVKVATAVPAFVGYTEKAMNRNNSLLNKPFRITSMAEFRSYFGGAPLAKFTIADATDADLDPLVCGDREIIFSRVGNKYSLYYQMLLFFANGGGACYIVSVGNYSDEICSDKLNAGVDTLLEEQEPTMVICPESVCLMDAAECASVQQHILQHCGEKMKNRIAILDVFDGYKGMIGSVNVVNTFRECIGNNNLDFASAYYPWVNTSIVRDRDLNFENLSEDGLAKLQELLNIEAESSAQTEELKEIYTLDTAADESAKADKHKAIYQISAVYESVITEMCRQLNLMAPSAAVAGAYTMLSKKRGVYNLSLNSVVSTSVNITNDDEEYLNDSLIGNTINAIRCFEGDIVKIMGASTLDGNLIDWSYINVRCY